MDNFKRFVILYIKPYWGRMLMVIAMATITSSYTFLLGFISKITVDEVLQLKPAGEVVSEAHMQSLIQEERRPKRDPQATIPGLGKEGGLMLPKTRTEKLEWLGWIFILYLVVRSFFATLNWFYTYNISYVGQRIVFRIRLALHDKVQQLQMTFFDRQQTGRIMSRILDDVGLLQSEITTTFVETLRHVARILMGTVILFTIDVELALMAFVALPAYVVTYKVFQRPIANVFMRFREDYAEVSALLEERSKGIRLILSYARERREFRDFFRRLIGLYRLGVKQSVLSSGLGSVCWVVGGVAMGLIFYFGALQVRGGAMTVGELVYFSMSMGNLFSPLVALANVNATLQQMLVVISRVFEVLDEEVIIRDREDAKTLDKVRGRVSVRNVSFRYTETGDYVLRDLKFVVRPGTSVAVVGPSGSGKSTLVSLLMRLYEPTEGKIILDDYDIQDVKISSLRQHISMVPQEPVLFSGTIADNIRYGQAHTSPEQVMAAAKAAELHDFIITLPEKYEAPVEERGTNLSGGQKQRLAFAMAVVTDPSILILDDTTSALDAKTEAKIQETLDHLMKGRTTFVITHRISTAMRADRILVLDNGRMAGWGVHDDLLEECEVYRLLYEQQQKQKDDAADEFIEGIMTAVEDVEKSAKELQATEKNR
ncbi:MAG: ABC transporter ATP-binding protein [Candidatus Latescibacteria bacterium]|nr:ABC transporter ATP-binding protein [Candidatus Latescibacterota bacterium]